PASWVPPPRWPLRCSGYACVPAPNTGSAPTCPARSPRTRWPRCSPGWAPAAPEPPPSPRRRCAPCGAELPARPSAAGGTRGRGTGGGIGEGPGGLEGNMAGITRGFVGRRRERDPRLPPGQYDARDEWPVLHAEATPDISTDRWTFTVEGLVENTVTWNWDEIHALPRSRYEGDIHCVTTWSKLGMTFDGVSVDTLLAAARPLPSATHAMAVSHTGYTTNLPLDDLTGGK